MKTFISIYFFLTISTSLFSQIYPTDLIQSNFANIDVVMNNSSTLVQNTLKSKFIETITRLGEILGNINHDKSSEFYFYDDIKYLDRHFKTKMNKNDWVFSKIAKPSEIDDIMFIELIIVKYTSINKARCDCDKIKKGDALDVFTQQISCYTSNEILHLFIVKGNFDDEVLQKIKNISIK